MLIKHFPHRYQSKIFYDNTKLNCLYFFPLYSHEKLLTQSILTHWGS